MCGSIVVNSCQIELARKDQRMLKDEVMIFFEAGLGSRNKVGPIRLIILAGTYSINEFNEKNSGSNFILKTKLEGTQVLGINLIITEYYTHIASNILFHVLGLSSLFEKCMQKSMLASGSYQTSLDESFITTLYADQ